MVILISLCYEVKETKRILQKYFHPSSNHFIYVREQCGEPKNGQQRVPILKKTTDFPSRNCFSMPWTQWPPWWPLTLPQVLAVWSRGPATLLRDPRHRRPSLFTVGYLSPCFLFCFLVCLFRFLYPTKVFALILVQTNPRANSFFSCLIGPETRV